MKRPGMGDNSKKKGLQSDTNGHWMKVLLWVVVGGFCLWMIAPHISTIQKTSAFLSTKQVHLIDSFTSINRDFGFSRMILVGLQAPKKEDVFRHRFVKINLELTQQLKLLQGMSKVLSLGSSLSIGKSRGTLIVQKLFPDNLNDYKRRNEAQTRKRVLRDPLLRGSLVSENGRATFLLCSLQPLSSGYDAKQQKQTIHRVIGLVRAFRKKYPFATFSLSGQPVVTSLVQDAAFRDAKAFLPVVLVLLFVFFMIAIPSWHRRLGLLFTFLFVSIFGFLAIVGQFGQWIESLFWFPMFAWWLLAIWGTWSPRRETEGRVATRSAFVAGVFFVAALSLPLAASPLLYIQKLGWTLFFGSLTILAACLFVPFFRHSFVVPEQATPFGVVRPFRVRFRVGWFVCFLMSAGLLFLQHGSELNALYPKNSLLDLGSQMEQKFFRGDAPLLIRFRADLRDPVVLKSIERLGRRLESHPDIHYPQSIAVLIRRLNALLNQLARVPDQKRQINALWMFLEGQPALKSLVRDGGMDGLLQARVSLKDHWKQREILQFLQHATADLPLKYKRVNLHHQNDKIVGQLLANRTAWIYEGVQLWIKRQFSYPLPRSLYKPLRKTIAKYVGLVSREDFSLPLETHRLQRSIWSYLSHSDCDIELKKKEQMVVLRALLKLNYKGLFLENHNLEETFIKTVHGMKGAKDKESIKYALKSLRHIGMQLSQRQLLESFQRDLFRLFRKEPRWIQAFSRSLRRLKRHDVRERMNELRAELMEVYNPIWIFKDQGTRAMQVELTGLPSILIPLGSETVQFVRSGLISFAVLGFLLFGLFFSRSHAMWKISLGAPLTILVLLGLMGWSGTPLQLPTGILLLMFGLLHIFFAVFYQLSPRSERYAINWIKSCLWMSVPFVPLMWASLPILQELALILIVGPWVAICVALWLAELRIRTAS